MIRQREVVDSIGDLELFYEKQVKLNGDYYNQFWGKIVDLVPKVIKMPEPPVLLGDTLFSVYPNHVEEFTRYDHPLLEELYSCIRNQKGTLLVYMNNETQYLTKAVNLMQFLRDKYHLNNE